MNERELIAREDLCATLHKEVTDLKKQRGELKEKLADLEWPPISPSTNLKLASQDEVRP